jgi:hypothetical protein
MLLHSIYVINNFFKWSSKAGNTEHNVLVLISAVSKTIKSKHAGSN